MHRERFRLIFRMELTCDEKGMCLAWQLDHLDELAIGRDAAKYETFFLEYAPIFRIEFIPVTVTFADLCAVVIDVAGKRAFPQLADVFAKTHRPAKLVNIHKIAQLENDRERCFFIE